MRRDQLDSFRHLWREAAGLSGKLQLGAFLVAGKLAPAGMQSRLPAVRVPFREFELEFRLSRGELTPYAQIQSDFETGIIPRPSPGERWLILDCGANIGIFSMFLRNAGRIIAVEPNAEVHSRLARNFLRNGLEGTTINKAVSSSVGNLRMDFHFSSVMASVSPTGETEVEATTLDAIARELAIDHVDLLKLDLEGHELEALRGAKDLLSGRRLRRIYAEFQTPEDLVELDKHLVPQGFQRTCVSAFNALYVLEA